MSRTEGPHTASTGSMTEPRVQEISAVSNREMLGVQAVSPVQNLEASTRSIYTRNTASTYTCSTRISKPRNTFVNVQQWVFAAANHEILRVRHYPQNRTSKYCEYSQYAQCINPNAASPRSTQVQQYLLSKNALPGTLKYCCTRLYGSICGILYLK